LFETNQINIGGPYTVLPLERNEQFSPSNVGWGGVSVDPFLGLLFVNVINIGQ